MHSFLADLGYRNLQLEEQGARPSAAPYCADTPGLAWPKAEQAPHMDHLGPPLGPGRSQTHGYPVNTLARTNEKPHNSELLPQRLHSNEPQLENSRLRQNRFVVSGPHESPTVGSRPGLPAARDGDIGPSHNGHLVGSAWGPQDASTNVGATAEPSNLVADRIDRQHVQLLLAAVRQSLQLDRLSSAQTQHYPSPSGHTNQATHGATAPTVAACMWQNPYLIPDHSPSGSVDVGASFTSPPPRRHAPPLPATNVDSYSMAPQISQYQRSTGNNNHLTPYDSEPAATPYDQPVDLDYRYREIAVSDPRALTDVDIGTSLLRNEPIAQSQPRRPHNRQDNYEESDTYAPPDRTPAVAATPSHSSAQPSSSRRMRATERALLEATAGFGGSLADVLRAPPPPRMAPSHPSSGDHNRHAVNAGHALQSNNSDGACGTQIIAPLAPFEGLSLAEALGPSRPRRNAPVYAPPDESARSYPESRGHEATTARSNARSNGRPGSDNPSADGFGGMSLGEVLGGPQAPPTVQRLAEDSSSNNSDGSSRRRAPTAPRDPRQWRQQRPREMAQHQTRRHANGSSGNGSGNGVGSQQVNRPLGRARPYGYNGSSSGGGGSGDAGNEASDYLADEEMTYERLLALDEPLVRHRLQSVNSRSLETRIRAAVQAVRHFPKSKARAPRSGVPDSDNHDGSSPVATTASSLNGVENLCEDDCNVEPCVICLESFQSGERLVKIRRCRCTRHVLYHEPCLKQWLRADASCPLCRTRAFDEEDDRGGGL